MSVSGPLLPASASVAWSEASVFVGEEVDRVVDELQLAAQSSRYSTRSQPRSLSDLQNDFSSLEDEAAKLGINRQPTPSEHRMETLPEEQVAAPSAPAANPPSLAPCIPRDPSPEPHPGAGPPYSLSQPGSPKQDTAGSSALAGPAAALSRAASGEPPQPQRQGSMVRPPSRAPSQGPSAAPDRASIERAASIARSQVSARSLHAAAPAAEGVAGPGPSSPRASLGPPPGSARQSAAPPGSARQSAEPSDGPKPASKTITPAGSARHSVEPDRAPQPGPSGSQPVSRAASIRDSLRGPEPSAEPLGLPRPGSARKREGEPEGQAGPASSSRAFQPPIPYPRFSQQLYQSTRANGGTQAAPIPAGPRIQSAGRASGASPSQSLLRPGSAAHRSLAPALDGLDENGDAAAGAGPRSSYALQHRSSQSPRGSQNGAEDHYAPLAPTAARGGASTAALFSPGAAVTGSLALAARPTIVNRVVKASEREAQLRMEAELQALEIEELEKRRTEAEARAAAAVEEAQKLRTEVELLKAEVEAARNDPLLLHAREVEQELKETRALAARLKRQVEIAEERAGGEARRREEADRQVRDLQAKVAKLEEELEDAKAEAAGTSELTLGGLAAPGGPAATQVFQFMHGQMRELRGALDTANANQAQLLREGYLAGAGGLGAAAGLGDSGGGPISPTLDRRLRDIDRGVRSLHETQQLAQFQLAGGGGGGGGGGPPPTAGSNGSGGGRLGSSLSRLENKVDQLAEEMVAAGRNAAAAAAMAGRLQQQQQQQPPPTAAPPPWALPPTAMPPGSPYLESMGVPGYKWHPYYGAVPTGFPPQQQQGGRPDTRQGPGRGYDLLVTDMDGPSDAAPPEPPRQQHHGVRIMEGAQVFHPGEREAPAPAGPRGGFGGYQPQPPPTSDDSGPRRRLGPGGRSKSARDSQQAIPPNKVREEDLRQARVAYYQERMRIQQQRKAADTAEYQIGDGSGPSGAPQQARQQYVEQQAFSM